MKLPTNASKIKLDSATVDFFEFQENNITYYYFDSSFCSVPEPMINAMSGLQLLESTSKRLVMINHSIPNGLFPKIKANFDYEVEELEDGNFQIMFQKKMGVHPKTNFNDTHCEG